VKVIVNKVTVEIPRVELSRGLSGPRGRGDPEARERGDEIVGQRRFEAEALAAEWVYELERGGVQREAAEANLGPEEAVEITLAVVGVAEQRVVHVLQMAANLMEAAGARAGLDERAALHRGRQIDRGGGAHGEAASKRGDGGDARSILAARDRVIDHALFGRDPAHEREVAFLGLAALERGLHARRGVSAPGDHDDAAGAAIEPMHRVDRVAEALAGEVDERDGVVAPAAMDEEAGRFGEGDEVLVAVENE